MKIKNQKNHLKKLKMKKTENRELTEKEKKLAEFIYGKIEIYRQDFRKSIYKLLCEITNAMKHYEVKFAESKKQELIHQEEWASSNSSEGANAITNIQEKLDSLNSQIDTIIKEANKVGKSPAASA